MNIDSVYLALVSLEFYRYLNYLESNLLKLPIVKMGSTP